MPQALAFKPIVKQGYEIVCYRCGRSFVSIAATLKIGYTHCTACRAVNYVRKEDDSKK